MNIEKSGQETPGLVKVTQESADDFRMLAPCAVLMGIIFTAGTYHNKAGIAYVAVICAALYIQRKILHKQGIKEIPNTRMKWFYEGMLLLLGVSYCTTDSEPIHMLDTLAFLLLGILYLQLCYGSQTVHILTCTRSLLHTMFLPLTHILTPLNDLAEAVRVWSRNRKTEKSVQNHNNSEDTAARLSFRKQILAGVLAAIPLLIVILMLLTSSDAVFKNLMHSIITIKWPHLHLDISNLLEIVFLFCLCYWCAYLAWKILNRERVLRTLQNTAAVPDNTAAPYRYDRSDIEKNAVWTEKSMHIPLTSAITILLPLTAVYVLFSVVQLICVFGRGSLPEGVTYADYVHEGFYQLCAVAMINLILYGLFRGSVSSHTEAGRSAFGIRFLKSLLTLLCTCTYIILISAAYRMILYVRAYQLTFLRLFVLWFMLVLTVWMTILIAGNYVHRFSTLNALIISTAVLYLSFAVPHPDYWIVRFNMRSPQTDIRYVTGDDPLAYTEDKYHDPWYMIGLSDDAVPALAQDPGMLAFYRYYGCEEGYSRPGQEKTGLDAVRCWNFSNWIADRELNK